MLPCAACLQSGRAPLRQRHRCSTRHGSTLFGEDGPSSSGRARVAEGRPAARRSFFRLAAYLQSDGESQGPEDFPTSSSSSSSKLLRPSSGVGTGASSGTSSGAGSTRKNSAVPAAPAGSLALVQEQGGASLLQLVAAWDQLAARLPPQTGAGHGADVILEALKLAMAYSPAPQPAAAGAGRAGASQLARPVARALSLASRLADLAAAGMPFDAESIAAGILTEVLLARGQPAGAWQPAGPASTAASSGLTLQIIEERVGPIVAQLVHDIKRARQLPARVELLDDTAASALRELCLSFYDVRATAVEIVARLDVLCSPGQPSHEQQVSALEALQMYAPMGHALGLGPVAQQLEDRCFQVLFPESYVRTAAWLREESAANADTLDRCQAALRAAVLRQPRFAELADGLSVHGRTKTLFSTLKKLLRLGNTAAGGRARAQLYDLMGLRAIVTPRADLPPEEAEALAAQACYLVRDAACSLWECLPERAKDYVAAPKSNGYQSLHSTVCVRSETVSLSLSQDGGSAAGTAGAAAGATPGGDEAEGEAVRSTAVLELQIRTQAMHDRAERGDAAHGAYKGGLDAGQAVQLKAVKDAVLRRAAAAAATTASSSSSDGSGSGSMDDTAAAAANSLFRHLDQNGDGRISMEELQFALQELGVHGEQAQSRAASELLQLAAGEAGKDEGTVGGSASTSSSSGASSDGTLGFEAFMAFQRRVGLLQALSEVDLQQANQLEEQHSAAVAAAAAGASSSSSSSGSMDEASSFSDPSPAAGLPWASGSFDGGDAGGSSSGSSRLVAGAAACRAHGCCGRGALGWQPPRQPVGRVRSVLRVCATAGTAATTSSSNGTTTSSSSSSILGSSSDGSEVDVQEAAAAAAAAAHGSIGGSSPHNGAAAASAHVAAGVANGAVPMQQDRQRHSEAPPHSSSSSSSNGAPAVDLPAATAASAAAAAAAAAAVDGLLMRKPERLPAQDRDTDIETDHETDTEDASAWHANEDEWEGLLGAPDASRREATAVWQAQRTVQGIVRLVSQEGVPTADATWQLVPAPSNPYRLVNAAGEPLQAAEGSSSSGERRVQALRVPEQGPCVVGAVLDRDCDYVLDVPTISGRHMRLEAMRYPDARGGYSKLLLTDLGSTNGTRVNRRLIEAHKEVPLKAGDVVTLAETDIAFEVQVVSPLPPRPTTAAASAAEFAHNTHASAGAGATAAEARAAQQALAALPPVVAALRIAATLAAGTVSRVEQGPLPPGGNVKADLADRARQLMTAGSYDQAYALLLAGTMQQPWLGGIWAQLANLERQRARRRGRARSSTASFSSAGKGSAAGGSYGAARAFFAAAAACFAALPPTVAGGALRAASERAEGLPRVLGSWAQLELAMGNATSARTLFRRGVAAAREHPGGAAAAGAPRLLVTWATREWKAGEPGEAQKLCVEALEADPGNPYALTLLGTIETAAGKLDIARRLFAQALQADPTHMAALQAWGRLEASAGSLRTARRLFRRALEAEPHNTFVLQAWGVAEARRGDGREARILLQRATDADPACRPAWHAWGKLEDESGYWEAARKLYHRVLELEPGSVPTLSALGCLERRAGDLAAAERHLSAALSADASHVPSLNELGLVRLEQGRKGEAATLKRRAARQASNRAQAMREVAARKLPQAAVSAAALEQL